MKRTYTRPQLIEYGRMAELTLGGGGTKVDLLNGNPTPTDCSDQTSNITSCNIVS